MGQTTTTSPPAPLEAHILVVDDDLAIRELIKEYLTENDFQVSVAESGADMDRVLAVDIVDLVILDLKLPDEDGLAIARRLRESLDIPIIILTGRKEEVDRVMGLAGLLSPLYEAPDPRFRAWDAALHA